MVNNAYNRWVGHLKENRMTYSQHFKFAFFHGIECMKAGVYLCIHSILPCFYQHAGSDLVHKLDKVFTDRENDISNNMGEKNGQN